MFQHIPQKRLLLYVMLLGVLPIIFAWFWTSSKLEETGSLENQLLYVQDQAYQRERKQALNMAVYQHFRDAEHFYIDKYLESITLLEPEIDSLKEMLKNPNFPEDENVKKRLETLTGPSNRMMFSEGTVHSTPLFQEVTETLVHPVEVNIQDLQYILCRIEGIPVGSCVPPERRPQLMILDFKLEKKNVSEKNQVFLLNLKLLKREFL